MNLDQSPHSPRCPDCDSELVQTAVYCPLCSRLTHAEQLSHIGVQAERAQQQGAWLSARDGWREALGLLPPGSIQHHLVTNRVEAMSRRVENDGPGESLTSEAPDIQMQGTDSAATVAMPGSVEPTARRPWYKRPGFIVAGIAFLAWRFKFIIALLLGKGKLLLMGLTKASTIFSMVLSLGAYWALFGWKFAAGLIASLYIHEMGHVAALRWIGIRASAPMFIPGLGAMVRLKEAPASPREDARVGLAGPIWGLAGVVATWAAYWATGYESLAAIARVAAWINLFNLIPFWQLDGNRGFRALAQWQRVVCAATALAMFVVVGDGMLLLVVLAASIRLVARDAPQRTDHRAMVTYVALVVSLSLLSVPNVPDRGLGPKTPTAANVSVTPAKELAQVNSASVSAVEVIGDLRQAGFEGSE